MNHQVFFFLLYSPFFNLQLYLLPPPNPSPTPPASCPPHRHHRLRPPPPCLSCPATRHLRRGLPQGPAVMSTDP